jgi:hypothetical protein
VQNRDIVETLSSFIRRKGVIMGIHKGDSLFQSICWRLAAKLCRPFTQENRVRTTTNSSGKTGRIPVIKHDESIVAVLGGIYLRSELIPAALTSCDAARWGGGGDVRTCNETGDMMGKRKQF